MKPRLSASTLINLLIVGYTVLLGIYSVFSYSLTAPNLILSSFPPYWNFQTWMWSTFFNDRVLLTVTFCSLIFSITAWYLVLIVTVRKYSPAILNSASKLIVAICLVSLPLLFANNALSYDVFNYIFNAKMVVQYQQNPHQTSAFEFAQSDDWLRFMHNVDTPAPYGYGWTLLSLFPYSVSGGKFLLAWLSFKIFGFVSLLITFFSMRWLSQQLKLSIASWEWLLVFLNPLLLLEIVSNSHNDLWMLWPAALAFGLVAQPSKFLSGRVLASLLLLVFSISIKLASVVLIPVWVWFILPISWRSGILKKLSLSYLPTTLVSSLLLFLPLLTERSKFFLPWYLIWSFIWWPLAWKELNQLSSGFLKNLGVTWLLTLLAFSLTVLTRYIPYLWLGEHTPVTLTAQLWFTWLPGSIVGSIGVCWVLYMFFTSLKSRS